MQSVNFKLLCEELIYEHVLHGFFNEVSFHAEHAKADYEKLKSKKTHDKIFIHNALHSALEELRHSIRKKVSSYVDVNSTKSLDNFLIDKISLYPGFRYLHSDFIKKI